MLQMPDSNVPGLETHGRTTMYADWVEASALFCGEPVSKADVRDYFYEENTFQRGGTDEVVGDIWSEMDRRQRALGDRMPIGIHPNRVHPRMSWQDCPAYAFCLLLSYSKGNLLWMTDFCNDYPRQGLLFEQVASDALRQAFVHWKVDRVGWSFESSTSLSTCIGGICTSLGECRGHAVPRPEDKDGGVDILCYRPFSDGRGDVPVFFVQCATGKDWVNKRAETALNLWRNWVAFPAPDLLSRAFAVPFPLSDPAFRDTQMRVNGLVLDRLRLLAQPVPESQWLGRQTSAELTAWLAEKLASLEGAKSAHGIP